MSEEFDQIPDSHFSSFVPLTIVLVGFLIWFGFQDFSLNNQRVAYDQQINGAMPTYNEAVAYASRYKAVLKDLIDASQKDPAATQILKEAMQAGWISYQPGANGTNASGTPADPAATK